jgi:hypothetical protein
MAVQTGAEAIEAYTAVVDAFGTDVQHEIEILPSELFQSSGQMVFLEGECVGIPKARLVQAFLVARAQFMSMSRCRSNILDDVRAFTSTSML